MIRWKRLLAAIVLLLAASCARPLAPRDGAVRVLVYNIHAGKDAAGRPNLQDVAALVRSSAADVVLLQEVDRGTRRSGEVDQLEALVQGTAFAGAFGRTLDYDGGQYGIAALSRHGFTSHETLPLPVIPVQARAGGSHEPRAALVAIAATRFGEWQVIATHLDASRDDGYRQQEADRLGEILRGRTTGGRPLLLGGDINATPDSAVVAKLIGFGLRDAWAECGQGNGYTYPSDEPVKRIDYLFLSERLRCTGARVIETTISDHRPLLVTVTSSGPTGAERRDAEARAPRRSD
jgi:endonuclease/exonuclease/phosphatase family metal-dependent hydrolase